MKMNNSDVDSTTSDMEWKSRSIEDDFKHSTPRQFRPKPTPSPNLTPIFQNEMMTAEAAKKKYKCVVKLERINLDVSTHQSKKRKASNDIGPKAKKAKNSSGNVLTVCVKCGYCSRWDLVHNCGAMNIASMKKAINILANTLPNATPNALPPTINTMSNSTTAPPPPPPPMPSTSSAMANSVVPPPPPPMPSTSIASAITNSATPPLLKPVPKPRSNLKTQQQSNLSLALLNFFNNNSLKKVTKNQDNVRPNRDASKSLAEGKNHDDELRSKLSKRRKSVYVSDEEEEEQDAKSRDE